MKLTLTDDDGNVIKIWTINDEEIAKRNYESYEICTLIEAHVPVDDDEN